MSGVRKGLAAFMLWVPGSIIGPTWMWWQDRLPTELPTHWGLNGPADAVMPAQLYFGWLFGVSLAVAVIGTVLVSVPIQAKRAQRIIGAVAGAISALVATMWLGSAVPSLDVADPFTVEFGVWGLVAVIAPCFGLLEWFLLPEGNASPTERTGHKIAVEKLRLSGSQTAAWSRTIFARLFLWVALLMLVLGIALFVPLLLSGGFASLGLSLTLYVAAFVFVAACSAVRVTADWRGFRVISLLGGIPFKRIGLSDISGVDAAELEPTQWGGWGYRFTPGRSAIILRKGPGLVITRRNGNQFAITLDNPKEPAGVLLGQIASEDT